MTWSVHFNGEREEVMNSVKQQCDALEKNQSMTLKQALMVKIMVDTIPGAQMAGHISGHGDEASGTMNCSITGRTQAT